MTRGALAGLATLALLSIGVLGCSSSDGSSATPSTVPSETVPSDDGGWDVTLLVASGVTFDAAQDQVTSLLLSLLADGRIEGYSGGQGGGGSTMAVRIQADEATITEVTTRLDQLDGVDVVGTPSAG